MCWPRWGVMSVTLSELSLRNAKRQARDYLVYFVTVVMAAALLYAFNGLVFSDEVRSMSERMDQLPVVIVLASIVVVGIFGWLVAYSTRFMLTRRSRELGTYLLIGLTNNQVARLFFLENLAVGGVALLFGLALGGLLYQAMRAIVMAMFRSSYHFSLTYSLPAIGLTAAYFALIYLYALRRNRKRIRKMKIYDLIYFDKRGEGAVIQTGKNRRWVFSVSIVLGIIGTGLLMARSLMMGIIGAGCLIFFLFGFFLCFASGVPAFFDRWPARKYRGQNLLVFRTLTAKLATMGVLMAVISMIFTATLLTEGSGFVIRGIIKARSDESACFDLYIGMEGEEPDPSPYLDYIAGNIPVEQSVLYRVYLGEDAQVQNHVSDGTAYYNYSYDRDPILRWSDYAALRAIAGHRLAEPEPGRYLIHCMPYLEELLRDYDRSITVGEVTLAPGSLYTEHFSQSFGMTNGRGYILVIPDDAAEGLDIHHLAYAAKTVDPVAAAHFQAMTDIAAEERAKTGNYTYVSTRADEEAMVAEQTTMFIFPLFYLALALTMTAAAILTIQQLSETELYRRQFALLGKLGMDRQEMGRALREQFAVYYAMPAVPALLIAVPFILDLAQAPEPGVMVGMNSPAVIVGISVGVFFLIYAVYILLAYTSLKRNVLPVF